MSGNLSHSVEQIIQYLLDDLSLGTLPSEDDSWPVFRANLPDAPDSLIAVLRTASDIKGRLHYDGTVVEHYGVQITVRGVTDTAGATKAQSIVESFAGTVKNTDVTIGSNVYRVHTIKRINGPLSIGNESPESKRKIFTINITVSMRQTT